jgi:hypothetical protein
VSYLVGAATTINLQSTLSASSSGVGEAISPHFPLTCSTSSVLSLEEDGSLACEHARVPAGDPRTQACIDHSIAILLIECLRQREDTDAG